jgi:ATP-dependent helicase/nuclease subunit A
MNSYLDTNRSVMISAPAGSGKTERLARRYIALLTSGVGVERILAITFTDKAAAEMKQRILEKLKKDDRKLFNMVLTKMPLMRVSTIHSFCGTLLRRFSFEAGLDPNYRVEDATDSAMAWEEVLYQVLMDAGRGLAGHSLMLETLGEKGFSGLYYLRNTIDYLFQKAPFSFELSDMPDTPVLPGTFIGELKSWPGAEEACDGYSSYFDASGPSDLSLLEKLFLTDNKTPRKRPVGALKKISDFQRWTAGMYEYWKEEKRSSSMKRAQRILDIYRTCIDKYALKKRLRGILDFSDLEYFTYRILTQNPEWANILYAFDEKTDHLLVDEFQDTNSFQWEIINSLTEEWRSGAGAKREGGVRPTFFYVGDEKQSIYYFRGANIEIFSRAKEQMLKWLGEEFAYEEVMENYRSRPAIVAFTNYIFSKIMSPREGSPPWVTRYSTFNAQKKGMPDEGVTEIIILENDVQNRDEAKQNEAAVLAQRIKSLVNRFEIGDHNIQTKPCSYSDMAVLLRKRTHLKAYEEALRQRGIPFVAVKGIGFYQEPEIATLRALAFFLSNSKDDYSLYVLLKSPLFLFHEAAILEAVNHDGGGLLSKVVSAAEDSAIQERERFAKAALLLRDWMDRVAREPLSGLIENALVSTGAWKYYHGAQEQANIKKFIRIIEDLEAQGKSLVRIRDFLERTCDRSDEPKANVNTEGMNAVKIMTIHSAKGLEFPMVFLPGMDDAFTSHRGDSLIYEDNARFFFKSFSEASIRNDDRDFQLHKAKEEEEQKRLLYVAVTRAEDALFLIGRWECPQNSFMGLIRDALNIERSGSAYRTEADLAGFSIMTGQDVFKLPADRDFHQAGAGTALHHFEASHFTAPVLPPWKGVTETADIRRRHGKEWITLGDILHRLFEGVSKSLMREEDIHGRADAYLHSRGFRHQEKDEKLEIIEQQISTLKKCGVWEEIIAPKKDSFAELPFLCKTGDTVFNGRIDRVIKKNGTHHVYDYKTFPVKEQDIDYFVKEYTFQLSTYKKAVRELFNTDNVRSFIIFTHSGELREV